MKNSLRSEDTATIQYANILGKVIHHVMSENDYEDVTFVKESDHNDHDIGEILCDFG